MLIMQICFDEEIVLETTDGPVRVVLIKGGSHRAKLGIDAPKAVRIDHTRPEPVQRAVVGLPGAAHRTNTPASTAFTPTPRPTEPNLAAKGPTP